MRYRVTAGAVTVEMGIPDVPDARARQDVRRGELLPTDVPEAEVRALLERGDIAPVEPETPAGSSDDNPDEVPSGTIAEVLAWVDGDRNRATRALAAEQDKGNKARSTLVDELEKLVGGDE